MLDLLSRLPRRLLLLKALQKKDIFIPAYTKADGTYVPAHTKKVNYNPDHAAVLSGKSSHSHKKALKHAHQHVVGFKDLPAEHASHIAQSIGQDIQTADSKGAQVSVFKKQLLAGKKPGAANIAAFKELLAADPQKAIAIRDSIISAIGLDKMLELVGVDEGIAPKPEPKDPTPEELAEASKQLQAIAAGEPGKKVGQQAYKLLEKDPAWVKKNAVDRLQDVVDKWKDLQAAATHGAKISTFTSKLAAGKVPSPSELAAYDLLDSAGKVKAIQTAHKKSGHKLSIDAINALLEQAEKKAGATVDKPEPVSFAPSFGQQHEGKVLGIPGKQAKFKFEGGKWHYWTGDGWGEVKAAEWLSSLEAGQDVLSKQPLEVVDAPGGSGKFGAENEGVTFVGVNGPYLFQFQDGDWHYKLKEAASPSVPWVLVENPLFIEKLNKGESPSGGKLTEFEPPALDPDDAQWAFSESDPGMSSMPSMTFENHETGETWYVVPFDPLDEGAEGFQVGKYTEGAEEPEFKDYASPERVQAHLQKHGIHPPTVDSLKKLTDLAAKPAGPQEGDTKQGVGGILTLKDGHWTLNNSEMLSFFTKHGIKPGSPIAIGVTMTVGSIAGGKTAAAIHGDLDQLRKVAKANGWEVGKTNALIDDLLDLNSVVLDHDITASEAAKKTAPAQEGYSHKLTFVEGKSDKFWQVDVDPVAKTATTTWGKNGAAKPQSKTYKHPTAEAALQAAKDAAAAKKAKGYKTEFEHSPSIAPKTPPAQSYGKLNEGIVFSAPMANGTTGFYKYQDGGWNFSFDPKDGWDPVPAQSNLHDKLETGFNASNHALLALGPESFGKQNEGKAFEATISTGKVVGLKYEHGKWLTNSQGVWAAASSNWAAAADKGTDIYGNPLKPLGTAGTVYTAKSAQGLILFKLNFTGQDWSLSSDQGATWQPINPDSPLGKAIVQGMDATGDAIVPHVEDAYGNPQGVAVDDGPKEGDIKPGADGWLVLKNGHWVKASLEEALTKLCPVPEKITSSPLKNTLAQLIDKGGPISQAYKKVATTKQGMPNVNLTIKPFGAFGNFGGKWVGYAKKLNGVWTGVAGMAGHNVANALNWLEHAAAVEAAFNKKAKTLPPASPFLGDVAAAAASPAAPAPKPAPAGPIPSIDGWKKVGEQGGYNPGGTYTDPDGVHWYCKFPAGGADVARNELLANKLYAEAGVEVPEVKLVSQNGKIGIASKIVVGAVQDKVKLQAGKAPGLLSGFVADAWLANWDVVGNNPAAGKGWDNIMFKDGKAVRIDPGGSMLFSGAGSKKSNFGDEVIELDTMRNHSINARTAKVFAGISDADLKASAEKVLSISDEQIDKLVQEHGPGDAAKKAALAKTLKARKAYIAAKFPDVAKKVQKTVAKTKVTLPPKKALAPGDTSWVKLKPGEKIVESGEKFGIAFAKIEVPPSGFKPAGIPKPPEYTYSSKQHVNEANTADLKRIYDMAIGGATPEQIENITFDEIDKESGQKTGKKLTIKQHPSTKYLLEYHSQVIAEVKAQLQPTYRTVHSGSFAESYSRAAKSIASKVKKLAHTQFKSWMDKAADYLVLDRSIGEAIPRPEPGHFKEVENLTSPLIKDWAAKSKSKVLGLPSSMQSAIKSYTGSSYAKWNTAMRLGETESAGWSGSSNMRKAFDEAAIELPEGIILHRGIHVGNQTYKSIVGAVIQDGSFQSCSYGSKAAFSGSTSQLRLHITAGVKAVLATTVSNFGAGEREIILDRNCRYLVMGVEGKHVDILVLPHEE